MPARKTWALAILAWGSMATLAQADPTTFLWDWTAWVAGTGVSQGTTGTVGTGDTGNATQTTPPPPTSPADAFLDFGNAPYPEQASLTIGTAQSWVNSPSVTKAYGGTPTPAQQQDFINNVLNDVRHTFEASGLTGSNEVSLTTDPGAGARHTLSLVSGLAYESNPNAIGITDVGANGFSFIDKLGYASTPQELEWAVAHNISHELMHAFGVGVHHDQTGQFLDAASAQWSLLANPDATLSPAAVGDILAQNIGRNGNMSLGVGGQLSSPGDIDGDQEILAPVPEPSTIALWGLAATALIFHARRRARRPAR
jgi:PEP-CTERM motif